MGAPENLFLQSIIYHDFPKRAAIGPIDIPDCVPEGAVVVDECGGSLSASDGEPVSAVYIPHRYLSQRVRRFVDLNPKTFSGLSATLQNS